VAIVSRGYKRVSDERETEVGVKGPENRNRCQGVNEMGDEPYMLQKKLKDIPVVVDADRVRGIKKAIRDFGVDTVVLDDAFQQWRIKKDLEIVAVDCTNPFGNKHMLPRGILREPLSSLRRADVFMLTKANLCSGITAVRGALKNINPSAAIFESWHQPADFSMLNAPGQEFPADSLKGKNIGAFCGIGDPVSFENTLKNLGGHIGISLRFPDHHNYTGLDLGNIIKSCRDSDIDTIVTTEKDAVRVLGILPDKTSCKFLVLRIELKLKDEQGFRDRLLKLYPL
jgi:tetraacyldisaccharide 4'-kinase